MRFETPIRVRSAMIEVGRAPPAPAVEERAAIEARWAREQAANPALWNGSFFLFERVAVIDGRLEARAAPTDFATFLHWRAITAPDDRLAHVFPVGAVTTADDRLLLGVMGPTTSNAGLAYAPAGSFDADDLVGVRLDPIANIERELAEETGLDAAELPADPGWVLIGSGPRRLAMVQRRRSRATAAELRARIDAHLARERHPELAAVRFVPIGETLPEAETVPYVNRLLKHLAEERGPGPAA